MASSHDNGEDERSFEQALDELDTVVAELESGDLNLDRMLDRYEHGMKLVAACQHQLQEAELRVTQIAAETGDPQ